MTSSWWAFVVHLFSQVCPWVFFSCCFASFVPLAGHTSLPQPLLLTKEWHASLAASATQPAPTGQAAVAKVSPAPTAVLMCTLVIYVLIYLAIICKILVSIFEAWMIYQMQDSTTQKQLWETSKVYQQNQRKVSVLYGSCQKSFLYFCKTAGKVSGKYQCLLV